MIPLLTLPDLRLALWPLVAGVGFWLLATAPWQPLGRPRPDLRQQLRKLNVEELPAPTPDNHDEPDASPLLPWPPLDGLLRPFLEDTGQVVRTLLARFGLSGDREVAAHLALLEPDLPPTQAVTRFWSRKVLLALTPLVLFAVIQFFGIQPLDRWPLLIWLLFGLGGFLQPDQELNRRLQARRERIVRELPGVIDRLVIGISAGRGLDQTLLLVASESRGDLAREFATALRDVATGRTALAEALGTLATRNAIPELTSLIAILRASERHGADLVDRLLVQSASLREQKRLRLLAEGKRAQIRMLIPVAICILPVVIVVLLAPAAVQILGFAR